MYKLIISGKIAENYDVEIVHEKLAIIFDIDLKKIPKLLKKPTVIRKNLSYDVVRQYKEGLEKIGVLCDTSPKLESELIPSQETEPFIVDHDENSIVDEIVDESDTFSFVEQEKTLVLDSDQLRVIDIKIPFGSMIILIIKWTLASIPAMIILGSIGYVGYLSQTMIVEMLGNFL